jgi:hypothetical protein
VTGTPGLRHSSSCARPLAVSVASSVAQMRSIWSRSRNPPVTCVHCPLLAWFGTKEPEIGTAADLELLKSTLQRLPTGPSRVDTVMLQNAEHIYRGEEAHVAQTMANWANALVPPSARRSPAPRRE